MNIEQLDIVLNHFYEENNTIVPFNERDKFSFTEKEFYDCISELEHDGYLIQTSTGNIALPENNIYKINTEGKRFIESGGYARKNQLTKEKIEFEEKKINLEMQKLQAEIDDLTNRLIDYRIVKRNSNIAILVSVLLLIIELLQLLF